MVDAPDDLGTMIPIVISAASFVVAIIALVIAVRGDNARPGSTYVATFRYTVRYIQGSHGSMRSRSRTKKTDR